MVCNETPLVTVESGEQRPCLRKSQTLVLTRIETVADERPGPACAQFDESALTGACQSHDGNIDIIGAGHH